jgi:hypothetical protein
LYENAFIYADYHVNGSAAPGSLSALTSMGKAPSTSSKRAPTKVFKVDASEDGFTAEERNAAI